MHRDLWHLFGFLDRHGFLCHRGEFCPTDSAFGAAGRVRCPANRAFYLRGFIAFIGKNIFHRIFLLSGFIRFGLGFHRSFLAGLNLFRKRYFRTAYHAFGSAHGIFRTANRAYNIIIFIQINLLLSFIRNRYFFGIRLLFLQNIVRIVTTFMENFRTTHAAFHRIDIVQCSANRTFDL